MESDKAVSCLGCGKSEEEATLSRCPICYKPFCDEHAYPYSGRNFCGVRCAEYFFFGGSDEDGDDDAG